MSTDVKVILFDADGVIQKSTRDFFPTLEQIAKSSKRETTIFTKLFEAVGGNKLTAQSFIQEIITAEQPCMVSEKDFPSEVQKILDSWKIDIPLNEVMALWGSITTYDDVLDLIKALQLKGYSCGLATNQQSYRANIMQKELDYDRLFDYSFYSCDMGVKKPNPEYFEHIVSKLEIPATQLLFIDDKNANVKAAQQVGLKAFVFNATKSLNPITELTKQFNSYNIRL